VKIEQLIVKYLYLNKQVTLQGIGTFRLDPAVLLPAGNEKEKDFVMPENALHFEYNLKAGEDEGLVRYIVQHTSKILPLASSDLESYSMLAKQFLNIGKPLVIEGVGTVQKSQQGNYQFIPGVFITPRIDDIPKQAREKRDETVSFETEPPTNHTRRNRLLLLAAVLIALAGLAAYYFTAYREQGIAQSATPPVAIVTDTLQKDSIAVNRPDTGNAAVNPAAASDTNGFKVVLQQFNSFASAQRAMKKLTAYGHKLVLITDDSLSFELAMPIKAPLSDTSRAKDSLKRFFGGYPYIKF
jgi:hypothetical protein